jgi:hypothetical protein
MRLLFYEGYGVSVRVWVHIAKIPTMLRQGLVKGRNEEQKVMIQSGMHTHFR